MLGIIARAFTIIALLSTQLRAADAVGVGSRLQLFLDRHLIDKADGVELRLHSPHRRDVVFTFDAPWEGAQSAYMTMLKDGETYRLYYRGGGDLSTEQTCLAESPDGVHFTRPTLNLYDFKGSKKNNIVYKPREKSYRESHNFAPFIDANPNAKSEQRYKAVGLGRLYDGKGDSKRVLNALASPDGIHWTKMRDEPVMTEGSFDSLNTVFWDPNLKQYVCYLRAGRDGKRQVQRAVSDDFFHWSKPQWLDYGNAPIEQFYTNGVTTYFREPTIYLGLPMRFVPERKTIGADHRVVDGLSDAILISSRDGLRFDRTFMEAFIRPGLDPLNWGEAHGNQTPAWGIVPTAGGNEISVYWTEHQGTKGPWLVRGTLRLDGFASTHAGAKTGELITRPIRFAGDELLINYATSAAGSVRVELQDDTAQAIPGFAAADCEEIYGDEVDHPVTWRGKNSLPALAGQAMKLRFILSDADLYSFRFQPLNRR